MQTEESNDAVRVQALCALAVLDTPPEERFDRLTRLACASFGVPIALVSLVDHERQWFKARVGLEATQTPRSVAFCSLAVQLRRQLEVCDARCDPRFSDNPLVLGPPFIRFYAGQPVFSSDGHAVGTLCIIDTVPRTLDEGARTRLSDLALLVQDELNKHALTADQEQAERALQLLNQDLERRVDERTRAIREANEALKREIRQREAVEANLRRSEERIRTIIETSCSAFISVDAHGTIVDWNASAERIFGWTREQVAGRELADVIIPEPFRAGHRQGLKHYMHSGAGPMGNRRLELPALTAAGGQITVEMTVSAYGADEGIFFGAFLHDISARKLVEQERRESEERLRTITDNLPVLIAYLDRDARFQFANSQYRQWYGLPAESMIGFTARELFGEAFHQARHGFLERCLTGEMVQFELPVEQGGTLRTLHTALVPHLRDGVVQGAYALSTDVTETRRHEAQLKLLADTDPLTGLPNRRSYEVALDAAAARSERGQAPLAVMYLDIDHFKQVNDTWGHGGGDDVLKEFAARLRAAVRKCDTVCRLAGDEFTIVLEGVGSAEECARVADTVIDAMRAPFAVAGNALVITTSIGIAWNRSGLAGAARLERQADNALYRAKHEGRNRHVVTELE